jgi:hypothetical protein
LRIAERRRAALILIGGWTFHAVHRIADNSVSLTQAHASLQWCQIPFARKNFFWPNTPFYLLRETTVFFTHCEIQIYRIKVQLSARIILPVAFRKRATTSRRADTVMLFARPKSIPAAPARSYTLKTMASSRPLTIP